jgi:predicted YcjX-like family ATPase
VAKYYTLSEPRFANADKHAYSSIMRARFYYDYQLIVKNFYQQYFARINRQIVLVDCLRWHNSRSYKHLTRDALGA